MDISHIQLPKLKAKLLFTPYPDAWKKGRCEDCGNKLYEMRHKPLQYCKSKKCRGKIYPRVNPL